MFVATWIRHLQFEPVQVFRNLAVVPLLVPDETGPEYLTLEAALGQGALTITEVVESGSVPELKVVNRASLPVLLLDGEEIAGAKQNRALNTTILLAARSETIIPVSCTEQGRWSYTSREFSASGNVLSHRIRSTKHAGVRASLQRERSFRSDQGAVWREITELSQRASTSSPTGAMQDVFASRKVELDAYVEAFGWVEQQVGLIVLINGSVVGCDAVSRAAAYQQVHAKLIRSYAMDALLETVEQARPAAMAQARAFLDQASDCQEMVYPSVGLGQDHRLQGQGIVGSALVAGDAVIHAAFFAGQDSTGNPSHMASARRRRGFRSGREQ